jgi:hypothetical protein
VRRKKLAPGSVIEHPELGRCVIKSVRKRAEGNYEALLEISGNGLFRKAALWISSSELKFDF